MIQPLATNTNGECLEALEGRVRIEAPPIFNEGLRKELAQEIKGPLFVADLLLQRNINEKEKARSFFLAPLDVSGEKEGHLLDLDLAIELLMEARSRREKVCVHGDYDVDGVTGCALMVTVLQELGFECNWFLPNRFVEGYGISRQSIQKISDTGAKWILSVDTGISAVEEVKWAKNKGIRVIISDHHQAGPLIPEADAVVNPNKPGCPYPNKNLSGVGVAYKLMHALSRRINGKGCEHLLDLVALGTLADTVPLLDENRSLVKAGLKMMASQPNCGLKALFQMVGINPENITSKGIVFRVTPSLNAVGRMGSPEIALKLLLSNTEEEAKSLATQMETENNKRKRLDQEITAEAIQLVQKDSQHSQSRFLVLASREWHEGVIGIVATRLVEKFGKPAFVLAIDKNGMAKGSGRTVNGFNLHAALGRCSHLLERWGGHYHACGLSIKEELIPSFHAHMNGFAKESLADEIFIPSVQASAKVNLHEINEEAMTWLKRFEPFGPKNENPIFMSENLRLYAPARIVGDKHLKLTVGEEGSPVLFEVIAYNMASQLDFVQRHGNHLTLAYHPEYNIFRGEKKIQLRAVAIA